MIAFVVGVAALSWLLRIVTADQLHWFAGYCLVAGMATVIWQFSVAESGTKSTNAAVDCVPAKVIEPAGQ